MAGNNTSSLMEAYNGYSSNMNDLGYTPNANEYMGMMNDGTFNSTMQGYNANPNNSTFMDSAGNFFGGKDGMSNAGSLLGGVAGLGQMYLANQQQKDTQKTNSLYRKLMTDEAAYRTKFRDGWGSVSFGGK